MLLISLPENALQTADSRVLQSLCSAAEALGASLSYNQPYPEKEEPTRSNESLAELLKQVQQTTGLSLKEMVLPKRTAKWVYARLLFAHLATQKGYSIEDIASLLQRSGASVYRLLQQYRDQIKFNPEFKRLIVKSL